MTRRRSLTVREIEQIQACLTGEGLLPHGQRLAYEPLRMDPDLGVSVYLEPDFAALTRRRPSRFPGSRAARTRA